MIGNTLTKIRRRGKTLGSSFVILALAGSTLFLTSCTTEEGILAGALTGAAIGGVVGHAHERDHRYRSSRHYYDGPRYYRGRSYHPRYSFRRGRGHAYGRRYRY